MSSNADLKQAFIHHLNCTVGRLLERSSVRDRYLAAAAVVRDRMMKAWTDTSELYIAKDVRVVGYLSAEFLLGPQLGNNLLNLGITEELRSALVDLDINLDDLIAEEPEPGLGNGGLGRLAACFMDSLATLSVPAIGYGIRYEYGMFKQTIEDGWQKELTDKWLQFGNPWDIRDSNSIVEVKFGGYTEAWVDEQGKYRVRWVPEHAVMGVPFDTAMTGYRNGVANRLRLWEAQATESFDFERFNTGDYLGAVQQKMMSETISEVLYPNDEKIAGKELRLMQQFFFTSCSLQDMIRIHLQQGRDLKEFHQKWAVQLNDTHPSIGIAELMRLLIDEHDLDWDSAWNTTQQTFGYTNHTLLPEALERWPIPLFSHLLPRHMEIVYEINRRFLEEVEHDYPGDLDLIRDVSLIEESGDRSVRMANLATVGSHSINGVAELHTRLLEEDLLHSFYRLYPKRFSNQTNGVTPRRWIALCNPRMAALVTQAIGDGWITDLDQLRKLEPFVEDASFVKGWRDMQRDTKADLAGYIQQTTGIVTDPHAIFSVQVKRIHEYKRQHLNVLHILTLYLQIKRNKDVEMAPRVFLFGGKSAPGYVMAKLIIKLINSVADLVNNDPDVRGRLKVVFLPNFNVTLGQRIYPAADLAEQISTAGKEASGTGCMKFAMNGAVTIGTLDGANIEIRNEVGEENFFLFGLTSEEATREQQNGYRPYDLYQQNDLLREVLDGLSSGRFSKGDADVFRPLVQSLLEQDAYMLLADYQSYVDTQQRVSEAYQDHDRWTRMSMLNSARSGKFSSDRTIREYCAEIWKTGPPTRTA
ncbi:glycogen/starch/alpha-glucan phosphorylase [Granulicella sp. dw_53]|uniref:glycogen/starch/alpha-glucan phosphorylase n=1 Tax=Granulicella sp. dw_53 TaxID=2719792 RepID=UPI0021068A32|nr:glycogen/starch/alpha-glucan phosphorylase [Granulicella sp. dw_53]